MIEGILLILIDKAVSAAQSRIAKSIEKRDEEDRIQIESQLATKKDDERSRRSLEAKLAERRVASIISSPQQTEQSLARELKRTARWAEQINFLDAGRSRHIDNIYIHLDIFLYPRRLRTSSDEIIKTIPLDNIFSISRNHCIILGQAGAGKTTSMKYLTRAIQETNLPHSEFNFAIAIRFRDLNRGVDEPKQGSAGELLGGESLIYRKLLDILNISYNFDGKLSKQELRNERRAYAYETIASLLNEMKVLLILDGFDELATSSRREIALDEIRLLAADLTTSRVIVTSRGGSFDYSVDHCDLFEIAPLSPHQVHSFALKWLKNKPAADDFVSQVSASPFEDTTIRPLSLAHLCAIYRRSGSVPEKPKTVYRKVINLLLEEWDEQRSVRRNSQYSNFSADRKFEFLSALAYMLTTRFKATSFERERLVDVYKLTCEEFDLPKGEVGWVVNELETHTSLFVQAGYELYEFAHKSLQEYLAAEYIVRLPNIIQEQKTITALPNELAIAIAISSKPSVYFSELVLNVFSRIVLPIDFFDVFIDRIVQERPDFVKYEPVVLALCTLLTLHLYEGKITRKRSPNLGSGRSRENYEKALGLLRRNNSMRVIHDYYSPDESAAGSSSKDDFIYMKRTRQLNAYRLPTSLVLTSAIARVLA